MNDAWLMILNTIRARETLFSQHRLIGEGLELAGGCKTKWEEYVIHCREQALKFVNEVRKQENQRRSEVENKEEQH